MFPERFISDGGSESGLWEELGLGAPTILGFARLCGNAIAAGVTNTEGLSLEAKAILFAARTRGVIEIKSSNQAFDAIDRFLAVYVELNGDSGLVFKRKTDPERTIRYLDAFRELCASGLVVHHLYREFSLTTPGFAFASLIEESDVKEALSFGVELSRHEW